MAKSLTPAEARKILEARKAADPCRYFMEHSTPTQKLILEDNTTYRCVSSSNQGGKTTTAIAECASILRGINPFKPWYGPVHVCIFVPSRAQAAGIWGERLISKSNIRAFVEIGGKKINLADKPLIPASEIKSIVWAYSPQGKYPGMIELKNGSICRIALSGDKKSWERVQGFTYDAIYRDEAVGNENLGSELFPRLAAAQTAVEKGERPWGGMILWVATETLVNDEFRSFLRHCEDQSPGYKLFRIDPSENPAVSMEVRQRMRSAMSETSGDSMADLRMFGIGSVVDTLKIFPQFDHRRHITEDYEPTEQDNLWVGWDPGSKDDFGLMFCAIEPMFPTTVRVIDFIHRPGTTLDYQAQVIYDWLEGRTLEGMIVDPSANKKEYVRGKPIIDIFKEILFDQLKVKTERGVLIGRNRLEDTVPIVQRYLDPNPDDREARPLLLFNQRAKYAADMIASARVKQGSTKIAFNTIDGKHLEAFDLVRYILSRTPHWCPRPPNTRAFQSLKASATPKPPTPEHDPFAITQDMTEDQKIHRMRLRESCRMMEEFGAVGPGGRSIRTRVLGW